MTAALDPTLATAYAASLAMLAGTVLGATIAFALVAGRIARLTEMVLDQRLLAAAAARPRPGKASPATVPAEPVPPAAGAA
ncbi:hypothetical protein [Methylobacterium oryzihabitans]|uniref:Uncharacterized protein n=1 Tax=Methylobacterium oryzihabitans TaxID=2499852 RepID=A0A3S2VKU3_9HYPH|nr:hypothetical protein [Methylobacterium oryzihabitans]RVU15220.1 hypothetical protein EOE48_20655 [Methylobacterium oryzihabitans]